MGGCLWLLTDREAAVWVLLGRMRMRTTSYKLHLHPDSPSQLSAASGKSWFEAVVASCFLSQYRVDLLPRSWHSLCYWRCFFVVWKGTREEKAQARALPAQLLVCKALLKGFRSNPLSNCLCGATWSTILEQNSTHRKSRMHWKECTMNLGLNPKFWNVSAIRYHEIVLGGSGTHL